MHKLVSQSLGAGSQSESRNDLGARVTGDPQLGGFSGASQFQAQFIELDMGEWQSAHQSIVQTL